jgi:hypothetical protein
LEEPVIGWKRKLLVKTKAHTQGCVCVCILMKVLIIEVLLKIYSGNFTRRFRQYSIIFKVRLLVIK